MGQAARLRLGLAAHAWRGLGTVVAACCAAGLLAWGLRHIRVRGARFANGQTVWDAQGHSIYPDSPGAAALRTWIDRFANSAPVTGAAPSGVPLTSRTGR